MSVGAARPPRRYHEAPLLLVSLVVAAGFVLVAVHHWRRGLVVIGGGVGIAAVLRGVLPPRQAGLLAVRGRVVDTATLGTLALAIVLLAIIVRN